MKKEIKISETSIIDAYRAAGSDTKEVLEHLFPDVDFKAGLPVTERIKTFEDACKELGRRAEDGDTVAGNLLCDYESNADNITVPETVAYMKLCIIAAALNEGWEPQFTTDEYRYFPWFYLYTKDEIDKMDKMDKEKRSRVVLRSPYFAYAYGGVACAYAYYVSSNALSSYGSRLAFKTRELAVYAGKQFVDIWADFVFPEKAKSAGAAK